MDTTLIALLVIGILLVINIAVSFRKRGDQPALDQDLITSKLSDALGQRFTSAQQVLLSANEERIKNAEDTLNRQQDSSFKAIDALVKPITESLNRFDEYVKSVEKSREGAYERLDEKVGSTINLLNALSTATSNLDKTLSSNQARGSWGELQLHRIIEHVGLDKHYSYDEQRGIQGDIKGRPDTQVKLPGNKLLYIDSKVPLSAYRQATEANDEVTRSAKLSEHAKDVRKHVDELARRDYARDPNALDVVVMFIPIEACLFAALSEDQTLLDYAASKRIVLAAPSSLVAVLTNISTSWMQFEQWQNADQIVGHARDLHGRLMTFVNHLAKLRGNLDTTVKTFNEAIGSFDLNVIPKARDIENLARLQNQVPDIEQLDREPRISRYENYELGDK